MSEIRHMLLVAEPHCCYPIKAEGWWVSGGPCDKPATELFLSPSGLNLYYCREHGMDRLGSGVVAVPVNR